MRSLLRAEWLRQRRRPDLWLLPVVALLAAVWAWQTGLTSAEHSLDMPPGFPVAPDEEVAKLRDPYAFPAGFHAIFTGGFLAFIAMVHYGASWTGSEFVRGTIRNIFLVHPARLPFIAVRLAALAILHEPELLILDEPTNGLDPAGVAEVRALIGALAREGTTVFLSTHVLSEVEQVCDRVAILDRGRIVTQTTTAELLAGDGEIHLRFDVEADAEAAVRILGGTGGNVRRGDGPAVLMVTGAGGGSAIVRALGAAGIYPAEVRPVRASLETVFLELTRDTVADPADARTSGLATPGPDA
jgi:hypothetical protein